MTKTGRCRDCRWWSRSSADELRADFLPENRRVTDRGECTIDGPKFAALDGDGYRVSLLTDPDFGCIQFEAKE